MAVTVISTIKPANNQPFPVAEANDIKGGLHQVETMIDLNSMPVDRITPGMLCYISTEDVYYKRVNDSWELFNFETIDNDMTIDEAAAMMSNIFKNS